ncbi:glycosyltransferase [Alteromonas genovensis]|uniref:Glycosyltransferase n=1 Tax=Alteromonas genovensis TaxID=471225 RepID=A0A6N9TRK4_9ALTE|nr:glycosyltransferase [Alteromonas genovensis]NDW17268.1 glycosyltransferase [Alteromonas genovensis]
MKKVIFFVKRFPVLSQTFVIEQINGLIDQGVDVKILSFYREHQDVSLKSLEKHKLLERTEFIAPPNSRKVKRPFKLLFLRFFDFFVKCKYKPMKPVSEFVKYAKVNGKAVLAYEVAITAWVNRHKTFKADSIIAHFGNNGVVAQKFISSGILKGNLNTVFHGYEISEYENVLFWKAEYVKLSQASRLLPISYFWRDRLESWGANGDAIKVLRMGVNVNTFKFKNTAISPKVKIVSVARATEKKGLQYAIEALINLDERFHLTLIGGGELEPYLKNLADKLGVSDKVTFCGPQSPSFVRDTLDTSDIFLLPSVVDSAGDMEGVPVALMEAMASGLTVISTFHSGIPELITNGHSGFLIPERDAKSIADAVQEAAASDKIHFIKENARKKVESEFNSAKLSKELFRLL